VRRIGKQLCSLNLMPPWNEDPRPDFRCDWVFGSVLFQGALR
jgi:hypothetical protein